MRYCIYTWTGVGPIKMQHNFKISIKYMKLLGEISAMGLIVIRIKNIIINLIYFIQ